MKKLAIFAALILVMSSFTLSADTTPKEVEPQQRGRDYTFCYTDPVSNLVTCCTIIATGQTLCDSWYPY